MQGRAASDWRASSLQVGAVCCTLIYSTKLYYTVQYITACLLVERENTREIDRNQSSVSLSAFTQCTIPELLLKYLDHMPVHHQPLYPLSLLLSLGIPPGSRSRAVCDEYSYSYLYLLIPGQIFIFVFALFCQPE